MEFNLRGGVPMRKCIKVSFMFVLFMFINLSVSAEESSFFERVWGYFFPNEDRVTESQDKEDLAVKYKKAIYFEKLNRNNDVFLKKEMIGRMKLSMLKMDAIKRDLEMFESVAFQEDIRVALENYEGGESQLKYILNNKEENQFRTKEASTYLTEIMMDIIANSSEESLDEKQKQIQNKFKEQMNNLYYEIKGTLNIKRDTRGDFQKKKKDLLERQRLDGK